MSSSRYIRDDNREVTPRDMLRITVELRREYPNTSVRIHDDELHVESNASSRTVSFAMKSLGYTSSTREARARRDKDATSFY